MTDENVQKKIFASNRVNPLQSSLHIVSLLLSCLAVATSWRYVTTENKGFVVKLQLLADCGGGSTGKASTVAAGVFFRLYIAKIL